MGQQEVAEEVVPSSDCASRRMKSTRRRDTTPELALRSGLHRLGLRYRIDQSPIAGSRRRADIVFRRSRVVVYVDGCFWHGCPLHGTWPKSNSEWWRRKIELNQRRDRETEQELTAAGWKVVRVWEHEDLDAAASNVAALVRERLIS